MVYLDSAVYCSFVKRNKVLIRGKMNESQSLMLSKREDSHKTSHILWFFLYEMSRIGQSIETGSG